MNPPHFHLMILPLTLLKPLHAIAAWSLLSLLALLASARLIARTLQWRWTPQRVVWVVLSVLICSATGANVITGQLTFVLMLPLTMAWVAARNGVWNRAAWLLGIVASIKPFLAIFWAYLFVARHLRPFLVMTGTAVLCTLVGVVVFGVRSYESWLAALSTANWWWAPMNGSISGFLARGLGESPLFTPMAELPNVVRVAVPASALVVGVLSVLLIVRDRTENLPDRVFAGLLLTAQLVSPLGWIYYLWFAAGPLLALRQSAPTRPSRLRDTLLLAALPGLVCPLVATGLWRDTFATLTIGSIYGWSTFLLWSAVLVDSRAESPASPVSSTYRRQDTDPIPR
jgi:hypothetical protein